LQILSYVAQTERDFNKKRQAEGIAIAKEKGKHVGRPKAEKPDNWNEIIKQWESGEITAVKAMEMTGTTKSTFYKLLKG
jgi:DNA invertase Pin-like site-specific DNA recombinase